MKITRACATTEECRLLHAALADFSEDGARFRYARWLLQQGDEARADAVRATIHAYHALDASAFEGLDVDACWGRMIAIPLLSALIRADTGASVQARQHLRDLVFPRIRAALSLSYAPFEAEPAIGASYLWGLPDMAEDEAWPTVSQLSNWYDAKDELPPEHHAAFLGQIAFSDMRGTVLSVELPSAGGFAVFAISETEKLGIVETLVRPWSNLGMLKRREAPIDLLDDRLGDSANSPQPAHCIELMESLSLPDATDGPFAQEIPGCAYGEPYHSAYRDLMEACGADVLGFGGYLVGTSGADPSPDTETLRFAVLRDTPDAGMLHFAVPAKDLVRGDLSRVRYVWNDWDG